MAATPSDQSKPSSLVSSVNELEKRVAAIEVILASKLKEYTADAAQQVDNLVQQQNVSSGVMPLTTVVKELALLLKSWEKKETEELKFFFEKYEEAEVFLSSETKLRELLLTQDMKTTVVNNAYEDITRIAGMLESMQSLVSVLDKPPFSDLSDIRAKIQRLEASTRVTMQEALVLHAEVEKLLDSYNSIIEILSQKFLFWNTMLNKYEEAINKSLPK